MSDDDMEDRFTPEAAAEMERIAADEEAFERLTILFAGAHGRPHRLDTEAYQWAASQSDDVLIALGFEDRAGFQYCYDLCLVVEQGPRAKDALN